MTCAFAMEESVSDSTEIDQASSSSCTVETPGVETAAMTIGDDLSAVGTPRSMLSPVSSCRTSPAASPQPEHLSAMAFMQGRGHTRNNSFQRWRQQMLRAWRWGANNNREQGIRTSINLELLANQKRQWYQTQSESKDNRQYKEPTSLFEHFLIVGLHSFANMDVIEEAFAKRKTWESEVAKSDVLDLRKCDYQGHAPTLEPQILFKYPPGKRLELRETDLPAFCFPEGVKAHLLERTPSMSDLNEVVFGQDHLARDDLSFIFCLKVSDNSTLYGVCLHVQEIVQRAPTILGCTSPLSDSPCKSNRFLVSAPRCYCILTRVPFFELHYEMLNSIIAQERLDRITQFVSDITLMDMVPRGITERYHLDAAFGNADRITPDCWMDFAIPIDSASGLTSLAGQVLDRDSSPLIIRSSNPQSPESVSASEASELGHIKDLDKDTRKSWPNFDDCASEISGSRSDSFERVNGSYDNGQASADESTAYVSFSRPIVRVGSLESVYSSARAAGSDEEDDYFSSKHETVTADEKVMEWAKAQHNESLQIVASYHALPVPRRGGELIFHPLEHLQPIRYCRPGMSCLVSGSADADFFDVLELHEVNARLGAAEEALALSLWTVATVCRVLSIESILALFAGALLEKQVVVICPRLGVLSAIVLSIIPMLRPFEWQSLLLPVLPMKMLDFLDAPVPFIVGIQHKPADLKLKTANLIRINVEKNQVKSCLLPPLPRHRELISELNPIHARLASESSIAERHPVYKCSEVQAEAAEHFLAVTRRYLESLCSDLRSHTITNIQSNSDKVSLLLKESFIDSFSTKDRPFIKLFVDTQLFSVLSDFRLSSYENE